MLIKEHYYSEPSQSQLPRLPLGGSQLASQGKSMCGESGRGTGLGAATICVLNNHRLQAQTPSSGP
jgi:hypothetical protein